MQFEDGLTRTLVNFTQWVGSPLPSGFNSNVFFLEDLALKRDGRIYINHGKAIYLCDPVNLSVSQVSSLPLDNTSGYVGCCTVRQLEGAEHLYYFHRTGNGEETLFRLANNGTPVSCGIVPHEDLLVPDVWCHPDGDDIPHIHPGKCFVFGREDRTLYVANGSNQPPSGFYSYTKADLDNFSGKPTRIHLNLKQRCLALQCRDANTLYYLSPHTDSSGRCSIRRIDLLPLPVTDQLVYDVTLFPEWPPFTFDEKVKGLSLIPKPHLQDYFMPAAIGWLQRSLNVVLPPTPPLQADGILGLKTQRALRSFQKKFHLVADGKPGPQTRAKLLQLLWASG
jgi:peptidoglycan hydrolase-like protein with peptidoglycan-binding domain